MTNKCKYLVVIGFVCICMGLDGHGNVYADSGTGNQGGNAYIENVCETGLVTAKEICPDKVTGGASWHIFKTTPPVNSDGIYKDGPVFDTSISALEGGGYNKDLATTCPSSSFDYYIAYVRDGWKGRDKKGNKLNVPTLYGPLGYNSKDTSLKYNKNGAYKLNELTNLIAAGTNINGMKIYLTGAEKICIADTGKGPCGKITTDDPDKLDIPDGTGFICVKNSIINPQYTLTAKAVDLNGNSLSQVPGLGDQSSTVEAGQVAELTRGTTNAGYSYQGWELALDGSYRNSGHNGAKYSATMNGNITVYFVYTAFSATSTLNIGVKNKSVAAYANDYASEVYAKPGDELEYQIVYTPNAQNGKNIVPQKFKINSSSTLQPANSNNTTSILSTLFNSYSGLGAWTNGYSLSGVFSNNHTYTAGDATSKTETHGHNATAANVGRSLEETAQTYKGTPKKVSIGLTSGLSLATVTTGLSGSATAKVPYNFKITPEVAVKDETVYAGESTTITSKLKIEPKKNNLTMNSGDRDYATKADNVKHQFVVYYTNDGATRSGGEIVGGRDYNDFCNSSIFAGTTDCSNVGSTSGNGTTFEANSNQHESKSYGIGDTSFTVKDLPAGSRVCAAMAVFPASSGADSNLDNTDYKDASGTSHWRVSNSVCFTIAKRPSMQVWGGSIYLGGSVSSGLSKKKHLDGYNAYDAGATSNSSYVFGSWGELGVVITGKVTGFASGASLGYKLNNSGDIWPNPYWRNDKNGDNLPGGYYGADDFCRLSVLTMANEECSKGSAGNLGSQNAIGGVNNDKKVIEDLVGSLRAGSTTPDTSNEFAMDGNVTYYEVSGDATVNQSTISERSSVLVHASGNIIINGDIAYQQGTYTKIADVPKLVIYSENNILINCGVGRIDAILVAKDSVVTCNNLDNSAASLEEKAKIRINDSYNAKQLVINGAVLAGKLIANRTFGAATGVNSMVSAEIINFDSTLYSWEGITGGDSNTNDPNDTSDKSIILNTVNIRELAPRL